MPRWWVRPVKRVIERSGLVVTRQAHRLVIHDQQSTSAELSAYAGERQLLELLSGATRVDPPIDLVVDVGANAGQFGQGIRQLGYRGSLLSFEPQAKLVEGLRAFTAADDQWEVAQLALGESEGVADLHIAASSDFSSLKQPNIEGERRYGDHIRTEGTEPVRVCRLDSLTDSYAALETARSIFLKIDTQGHDMAVLEGASGILDRVTLLQMEVAGIPIYHGVPRIAESLARVAELGFLLTGIFAINVDHESGALVEADARFVRAAPRRR